MVRTLSTGPVAPDMQQADSAAIQESLRQPERFAVLYDRYARALHRYASRRVGADNAHHLVAAPIQAPVRAPGATPGR